MGWGCYRHEWDHGSEDWTKFASDLAEKRCRDPGTDWGRNTEICPKCFLDLEEACAALSVLLDEAQEAAKSPKRLALSLGHFFRASTYRALAGKAVHDIAEKMKRGEWKNRSPDLTGLRDPLPAKS